MSIRLRSLLVLAAVIAPFTLLRFSFFGLAEAIFLLVILLQLFRPLRKAALGAFWLSKFWLLTLAASLLGMAINWIVSDHPTSTLDQTLFDLGAYGLILGCCFALERLATHSELDVAAFAKGVFLWSGGAFCVLYILSLFVDAVFGIPLKYYDYFVPLAENLHQVSMSLVPLPFIGMLLFRAQRGLPVKLVIAALIPLFAFFAVSTGSAKAVVALVAGCVVYAYSRALRAFGARHLVIVNLVFAILAVVAFASFDWVRIGEMLFESEDIGGTRGFLYGSAFDLALNSPIFGRGPGSHVPVNGEFVDAHQTLLTLALQAGAVGVIAFLWMAIGAVRRLILQPELLAAFTTLMVYGAGGDILRRLPAWIMLFLIFYYLRSTQATSVSARRVRDLA